MDGKPGGFPLKRTRFFLSMWIVWLMVPYLGWAGTSPPVKDCHGLGSILDTRTTLQALEFQTKQGMPEDEANHLRRLVEQAKQNPFGYLDPTRDPNIIGLDPRLNILDESEYARLLPLALQHAMRQKLFLAYLVIDINIKPLHKTSSTHDSGITEPVLRQVVRVLSSKTKLSHDYLFRVYKDSLVMLMLINPKVDPSWVLNYVAERVNSELDTFVIEKSTEAIFREDGQELREEMQLTRRSLKEKSTQDLSLSVGAVVVNGTHPKHIGHFAPYLGKWTPQDPDRLFLRAVALMRKAKEEGDGHSKLLWKPFEWESSQDSTNASR
jgi:hypothetical protein